MDITPWIEKLTKEGAVIYDAPFVFGCSLLFACLVIWWVVRLYYAENIKMKDDLISSFRDKLAFAERNVQALNTVEKPKSREEPKNLSAGEFFQEGIEFFATIDELRNKHPLPETFKHGNELHAYFLSGEGVFAEHNDYIKYVRRLILPNEESENIQTLRTFMSTDIDYRSQIAKYRSLAKKNQVSVRLFQSFTGVSLLFCNPDRSDGWVQVGTIIPCSEPSERHHYRLYKTHHEKAFLALYKTFEQLWNASIEQTYPEAFDEGFRSQQP